MLTVQRCTLEPDAPMYRIGKSQPFIPKGSRKPRKGEWVVCIMCECHSWVIPMGFAREVDAQRASAALKALGIDWEQDKFKSIAIQMREFGTKRLRQVMLESLAW